MSIEALRAKLPEYAKDLRLNLSSVMTAPALTPAQVWGTALASAIASRNAEVIAAVANDAAPHLDQSAEPAARAAAAIMSMTNIYYRFTHLASAKDYETMPARLRMNVIASPGVEPLDFALWCLAVSAINGCGRCIDAHEKEAVAVGASREAVQSVVRIASVIYAVAVTLGAEQKLAA